MNKKLICWVFILAVCASFIYGYFNFMLGLKIETNQNPFKMYVDKSYEFIKPRVDKSNNLELYYLSRIEQLIYVKEKEALIYLSRFNNWESDDEIFLGTINLKNNQNTILISKTVSRKEKIDLFEMLRSMKKLPLGIKETANLEIHHHNRNFYLDPSRKSVLRSGKIIFKILDEDLVVNEKAFFFNDKFMLIEIEAVNMFDYSKLFTDNLFLLKLQ